MMDLQLYKRDAAFSTVSMFQNKTEEMLRESDVCKKVIKTNKEH